MQPAKENDHGDQTGQEVWDSRPIAVAQVRAAVRGIESDGLQTESLRLWAEAHGRLFAQQQFSDQWDLQRRVTGLRMAGTEQQVLLGSDGTTVHKRKLLWPVETWDSYFNRLEAHALHFPETDYVVHGFTDGVTEKGTFFMALVSQAFSERRRDATEEEIRACLEAKGFEAFIDPQCFKLGLTDFKFTKWHHKETGHLVSDLGPNNIWLDTSGKVAVVDPNIESTSV